MSQLLDRVFHLNTHRTDIRTEVLAGLTTFSTMAYIILVNPLILKEAGMDFGAVMVATILTAGFSTLLMGLFANYPFALAPGMGLNAFFTYTLVLDMGLPWEAVLGACFLAGVIFLILNFVGIRELILIAIPISLRAALTAGIGLFIAFIGLSQLKLVVPHPETLVTVGNLGSPEILLAAAGLVLATALMAWGISGGILISILVIWAVGIVLGITEWQGIVALPPTMSPTFLKLDIWRALHPDMFGTVLAFSFIAIFDAAGTITGLGQQGHFFNKNGSMPRIRRLFVTDALGTVIGATTGTSMVTTYMESAAGVSSGGRTGLTAVVVALLFFVSLFFAPLAGSIPFFATAPAFIIIGAQMLSALKELSWEDPTDLIPSFLVLITIPLTFSISTGIAMGLITWPLLKIIRGQWREVHWLLWILAGLFVLKFTFMS